MDRRQIGTKLALDAAGIELDLDDFDKRLILQKSIYLLQEAGVKLGYSYSWYLKGPYSSDLTSDAFDMKDIVNTKFDDSKGWSLDVNSCAVIEGIKSTLHTVPGEFDDIKPPTIKSLSKWLELLASVHFLIDTSQATRDDIVGIRDTLLRFKKAFTPPQITIALQKLDDFSLI